MNFEKFVKPVYRHISLVLLMYRSLDRFDELFKVHII